MNRRALHTLALAITLALCACADPPEGPKPSVVDGFDDADAGADVGSPGEYARGCAAAGEVAAGGARARLCLAPSHAASGTASGGGSRLIASPPRVLRAHTSSPR